MLLPVSSICDPLLSLWACARGYTYADARTRICMEQPPPPDSQPSRCYRALLSCRFITSREAGAVTYLHNMTRRCVRPNQLSSRPWCYRAAQLYWLRIEADSLARYKTRLDRRLGTVSSSQPDNNITREPKDWDKQTGRGDQLPIRRNVYLPTYRPT